MQGLGQNFADEVTLAVLVTAGTAAAVVAAAVWGHRRSGGSRAAARTGLGGAVAVVVLSTAMPRSLPLEGRGDLALVPGRGGLGELEMLWTAPTSLPAVLLVLNVAVYLPVGFFAGLLWRRAERVLGAALALSLTVELSQLALTGRVASTDDVVLNLAGTVAGLGLARVAPPALRRA